MPKRKSKLELKNQDKASLPFISRLRISPLCGEGASKKETDPRHPPAGGSSLRAGGGFIAFLQAAGLVIYCGLVGVFFWQAERIAGPPFTFLGPTLFLVLFVVSALVSALAVLGYPFLLFWEKKETIGALRLIVQTIGWLVFFVFLLLFFLIIF